MADQEEVLGGVILPPRKVRALQPRWKTEEVLILIAAKRAEFERNIDDAARDRMKTADCRWNEIAAALRQGGVIRTGNQTKKKWDSLMLEFKKVYDYYKVVGSGQLGYYELNSMDRRDQKLPSNFAQVFYDQMIIFVPKQRAVNPSENQVADSTADEDDENAEGAPIPSATEIASEDDIDNMEAAPMATNNSAQNTEPVFDQSIPARASSNEAPDATDRGWKRAKRNRTGVADGLTQATKGFTEAVSADAAKRHLHDQAYLDFEKEKWAAQHALEIKKHEEVVATGIKVSAALLDVGSSVRFFAVEMAKRK